MGPNGYHGDHDDLGDHGDHDDHDDLDGHDGHDDHGDHYGEYPKVLRQKDEHEVDRDFHPRMEKRWLNCDPRGLDQFLRHIGDDQCCVAHEYLRYFLEIAYVDVLIWRL